MGIFSKFKKKKIGLALGGGSAKGVAHVGVLKVLEENNLKVDMVSGTSIGSLVGAFYCSGMSAEEMTKEMFSIDITKFFELNLPRHGFIKGNKIETYIREKLPIKRFEDLKIPLFITASDLTTGDLIVFNKGDIAKAIRASISIPGVFNPVENNGRILVDGGIVDPLPTQILKENKADKIIAVNLIDLGEEKIIYEKSIIAEPTTKLPRILPVLFKGIQMNYKIATQALIKTNPADILISPDLKNIGYQDFHKAKQALESGEQAARKSISEIKAL